MTTRWRKLLKAAKAEGEKMWPMPLEDEYKEQYLKSPLTDLPNVGGRWGGSITAAAVNLVCAVRRGRIAGSITASCEAKPTSG